MPGVKVTTNFFLVLTLAVDAVLVVAVVLAVAAMVRTRKKLVATSTSGI